MARKRIHPEYSTAGRPTKDPMEKVGRPVRALVTQPVMLAIKQDMELSGMTLSEVLRIAIYERLQRRGLLTVKLQDDPTFDTLKEKGLV